MFRLVTLLCSLLFVVQGFNVPSQHRNFVRNIHFRRQPGNHESLQSLRMGKEDNMENESQIARLKAASAKLRAEVAELEAAAKKESAKAVEEAFKNFDTNNDGTVSADELREGLEKLLKLSVSEKEAEKLLSSFDTSKDGVLQIEEFPKTIEQFRARLEDLAASEKEAAQKAANEARIAKEAADLAAEQMKAINEVLNDRPPTPVDRVVSILPYLLPLVDSLRYGKYIVNGMDQDNVVREVLAVMYITYQNIPFSGLLCFFILSTLSNNLKLNKLVRWNLQQAIYLDIALVFPGILGGIPSVLLPKLGVEIPEGLTESCSSAIFFFVVGVLMYCSFSSLLGIVPDKIPLVSTRVESRVPSADQIFTDIQSFNDRKNNKDKKK